MGIIINKNNHLWQIKHQLLPVKRVTLHAALQEHLTSLL